MTVKLPCVLFRWTLKRQLCAGSFLPLCPTADIVEEIKLRFEHLNSDDVIPIIERIALDKPNQHTIQLCRPFIDYIVLKNAPDLDPIEMAISLKRLRSLKLSESYAYQTLIHLKIENRVCALFEITIFDNIESLLIISQEAHRLPLQDSISVYPDIENDPDACKSVFISITNQLNNRMRLNPREHLLLLYSLASNDIGLFNGALDNLIVPRIQTMRYNLMKNRNLSMSFLHVFKKLKCPLKVHESVCELINMILNRFVDEMTDYEATTSLEALANLLPIGSFQSISEKLANKCGSRLCPELLRRIGIYKDELLIDHVRRNDISPVDILHFAPLLIEDHRQVVYEYLRNKLYSTSMDTNLLLTMILLDVDLAIEYACQHINVSDSSNLFDFVRNQKITTYEDASLSNLRTQFFNNFKRKFNLVTENCNFEPKFGFDLIANLSASPAKVILISDADNAFIGSHKCLSGLFALRVQLSENVEKAMRTVLITPDECESII
ncbi:hypothetical protein ACOME3_002413 [Neoechinorhynchus agilis]